MQGEKGRWAEQKGKRRGAGLEAGLKGGVRRAGMEVGLEGGA